MGRRREGEGKGKEKGADMAEGGRREDGWKGGREGGTGGREEWEKGREEREGTGDGGGNQRRCNGVCSFTHVCNANVGSHYRRKPGARLLGYLGPRAGFVQECR